MTKNLTEDHLESSLSSLWSATEHRENTFLYCPFFLLQYDLQRLLKQKSLLCSTNSIVFLKDHFYAMIQEITNAPANTTIYSIRGTASFFGQLFCFVLFLQFSPKFDHLGLQSITSKINSSWEWSSVSFRTMIRQQQCLATWEIFIFLDSCMHIKILLHSFLILNSHEIQGWEDVQTWEAVSMFPQHQHMCPLIKKLFRNTCRSMKPR